MPSSRRGFALLCIYAPATNRTPFVGADARIGPHDGLNPDVHIELSPLGHIAEQALLQMDGLLHYVIMPNHIHFLVGIQPKADGHSVFQRSFYDHIIRTETDYWAIVQYIDENLLKWVLDPLYQEGTP